VDVGQRISTILKENPQKSDWFCEMISERALEKGGMLGNGEELDITIEGSRCWGTHNISAKTIANVLYA
jgi:hypothetical protein